MKNYNALKKACTIFISILVSGNIAMAWAENLPAATDSSLVEAERQNWEFFKDRSRISALLLSDDSATLWVGTDSGLEERDKVTGEIKNIYTKQKGLPGDIVVSLLSDSQSGIWVGTGDGLAHMKDDGSWEVFTVKNSGLPNNAITSLCSDGMGGIWMGCGDNYSSDSGLAHMKEDGSWEVLNKYNSCLPSNGIELLLADGQGGLWISTWADSPMFLSNDAGEDWFNGDTGGVLSHLKFDGTWEVFNTLNSDLPDNVTSLLLDGQGGIWVGTGMPGPPVFAGKGLAHLKSDLTWDIFNTENSSLQDNLVSAIGSDGQGGLWVGTFGGIAHMRQDGQWGEVFSYNNSDLPLNLVTSIVSDSRGGIWIGTWSGLVHLKSGNISLIEKDKTSLPNNYVTAIISDYRGGIWVGTEWVEINSNYKNGLGHFKSDNTWEMFNSENSRLPFDMVNAILSDGQGGIWAGSDYYGLAYLKGDGTCKVFNKENSGLPGYQYSSIISDGHGGIWLGTESGLGHLKSDSTWEVFDTQNSSLPDSNVEFIISDGQNGIWLSTHSYDDDSGALVHLGSDAVWEVFNNRENLELPANYSATCLLSDNHGGVWIGTDVGIGHMKSDSTWELFNAENSGLPENQISSLVSDGQGGIWAGVASDYYDEEYIGSLCHMKPDGTWEVFNAENSGLSELSSIASLLSDVHGGIWIGTYGRGLVHLLLIGVLEQIIKPDSPEIIINWFLNSAPFDYQKVKYIELQRSLSKTGIYETVRDVSDNPVRFYADYSECPNPRVANCWPKVEGHTPAFRQDSGSGDTQTKGYTLNTPITDPEWLEGLPRYYRLSAVIEEDGKFIKVANDQEAVLVTPQVEEKPRVELSLDRNAIAMLSGTKTEVTVFVSSLDLFTGDVSLEVESDSTASDNFKVELATDTVTLKPGAIEPVTLTIEALSRNSSSTVKILAGTSSGYSGQSASLNVQTGSGATPMIALGIARSSKRSRVLDDITVSGNIIPANAGQEVLVAGSNVMEPVILITRDNGEFEGTVTTKSSGLMTLSANSNGTNSNNAELFILPAKTTIALTSNVNQATRTGDMIRVQGIVAPVRLDGVKVNLDIRYIDPADSEGGLQPQFLGDVNIDLNGMFYKDVVVPGDGFINVKASLPETFDYLSVNTKLVIPVGQPVGEGIIMVSESGSSEFQSISKTLGQYVYNALASRNIPADRIKYLGLTEDSEIIAEEVSKSNLHEAITSWVLSLISTDDPYKTPLNLYLVGQVEEGGFRLNDNEILTAEELSQYLDEAEAGLNSNKGFPVTILIEGSQSGKWIEKIAGNGRIILASSSDKPVDEGGYAGYSNLGESSFSRYFYQFINYGSDIEGSFAEANYEILKLYRHTQRPVMDADGDGVGTTRFDRYEASGKFIEYRPSGDLRPQIRTTNPDMTIHRGADGDGTDSGVTGTSSTLWAIATDPENDMQGVFCSVTDPSERTVNIEMNHDTGNFYSTQFNHYPVNGCYQVIYYAKDRAGNVSLPEQKFLNITGSGVQEEGVPEPPELRISVSGEIATKGMVTISWSKVSDADGYTLFYAPYPDAQYIEQIDMGRETMISFDGTGLAFYGAIKAYNSKGSSDFSNVAFFDLRQFLTLPRNL